MSSHHFRSYRLGYGMRRITNNAPFASREYNANMLALRGDSAATAPTAQAEDGARPLTAGIRAAANRHRNRYSRRFY